MQTDITDAICVYGASRSDIDAAYHEAARTLGSLVAGSGRPLVCGGGRGGLMASAIDGALAAGGVAVGVLPSFMVERGWQHPGLTRMVEAATMHERKAAMAAMSAAAVALPGGVGTLEELMEIITWRQLNLFKGPVVILNTLDYYDTLLAMLDEVAAKGFMRPGAGRLWHVADTPAQAMETISSNI